MGRRKKKALVPKDRGPLTVGEWSVGDIVWGIRPNKEVCKGEIVRLYETEPIAQIVCNQGRYLICELSTLEENSSMKEMKKKAKDYDPGC